MVPDQSPTVRPRQPRMSMRLPTDEKELDRLIRLVTDNSEASLSERFGALEMIATHLESSRKKGHAFQGRLFSTMFARTGEMLRKDRQNAAQAGVLATPRADVLRQVAETALLTKLAFEPRDIPTILRSCATCKFYHEPLFSELLSQAAEMVPRFKSYEIGDIARVCGKFQVRNPRLFYEFEKVVWRDIKKWDPLQVGDIALSFSVLGEGDPTLFAALGDRMADVMRQSNAISPHAVANVAFALGASRLGDHPFFTVASDRMSVIADSFFPNDICNFLQGCVDAGSVEERIFKPLVDGAYRKKRDFQGRTIAKFLNILSDSGWTDRGPFEIFGAEIKIRATTFTPKELGKLALTYAESYSEHPDVFTAILAAWDASDGLFRQKDVTRMIVACQRAGVAHPGL